jgi:hypothetical protein
VKEELKSEQKPSESSEPECIEFLKGEGLNIEDMFLSYWERWKARKQTIPEGLSQEEQFEKDFQRSLIEFEVREKFIQKYGFAILSRAAIEAMRPYAPLLEIGSGSGYWAYELQKNGIGVIATDTMDGIYGFFPKESEERRWQHRYTEIEQLSSVEAVRKYPRRNLLTVWPDYDHSWATDALNVFTGQVVIYMGEGYGNATADDRFHELLDQRFGNQEFIPMPHFEHSYDRQLRICKTPKQLKGNKTT